MNLEAQSSSVSFDHDVHFFSLTSQNIEEYILKQVKRKLENGLSQSVGEGILSDLASLLDNDLIPTKWSEVMKLLRKLGYSNPRHFKVCCGSDHSFLLRDEITNCLRCNKPRNDCIDYYVLGLGFEDWFVTNERCSDLLGHWEDKSTWFNVSPNDDISLIELWHGSRYRELSYFWDSSKETLLPTHCTHCNGVVCPSVVSKGRACNTFQVIVECPHCEE